MAFLDDIKICITYHDLLVNICINVAFANYILVII